MAEAGETMTAPALSLRKGDFVTLLVGPDEEEFAVHESCITRNSDFFKAAMSKEWAEGADTYHQIAGGNLHRELRQLS